MKYIVLFLFGFIIFATSCKRHVKDDFSIIAYYTGDNELIDDYPVEKLTHVIFSFCHLKGNRLTVDKEDDSLTISHLVSMKKRNPDLKVILSLGGWGGCETCSDVFATEKGRTEFTQSVMELLKYFKADGLDLDWEYPTIAGFPQHHFSLNDKDNFTALLTSLRKAFGEDYELSFAAGGFKHYLEASIDWKAVIPLVDKINLMTYDLVNGYSKVSGHHTPLYSSLPKQKESIDNVIQYFEKNNLPKNKLIIGAAFYSRSWEEIENVDNGLYQHGKHRVGHTYREYETSYSADSGFVYHWDSLTMSPYYYSESKKTFASVDNEKSIELKTRYAKDKHLGGIMFWELTCDKPQNGLLDVMYKIKTEPKKLPQ